MIVAPPLDDLVMASLECPDACTPIRLDVQCLLRRFMRPDESRGPVGGAAQEDEDEALLWMDLGDGVSKLDVRPLQFVAGDAESGAGPKCRLTDPEVDS
ncbi:MAG TPA: hypothetical protein VF101_10035 [Gaiellaceae bacterium]